MNSLSVSIAQGIATISFNRPESMNAITAEDYEALSEHLAIIDKRSDVIVTLVQATGKFFCSGTDVKVRAADIDLSTSRKAFLNSVSRSNTDCSKALYNHSKLLIAALNGPVMGIAAAFLGHFDFVYCMPNAWLAVPFTFLGIISEAGSSVSFVNRMGLARANEVLIFGRKLNAQELLRSGFVNEIFPEQSVESFHAAVRQRLLNQLDGLVPEAVLTVKKLIQFGINEKNSKDGTNMRESYTQAEQFASGIPVDRFAKIARKEIKHKL